MPGLAKPVTVDCAFGGMWYAIVNADSLGLDIKASHGRAISKLGEERSGVKGIKSDKRHYCIICRIFPAVIFSAEK